MTPAFGPALTEPDLFLLQKPRFHEGAPLICRRFCRIELLGDRRHSN